MKFYDQGALYTVSYTSQDADNFADKWPTSTVKGKGSFQFSKRNGDLVDATGSAAKGDGSDWLTFSQDLQAWGEAQLKKATKGASMESLSDHVQQLRTLVEGAPKKIKGKKLSTEISRLFHKHGSGAEINIFDLGKISKAGESAYTTAADHEAGLKAAEDAIVAAIKQYRQN